MDLAVKYDKTNLLGDGEVQVWRGRERSRGTPVLLHTFTGSPKLLMLATQYLLKQPANSPLLDIGEWDGATCLVTVSELDLLDVKAWLENAVASGPAAPPAPQPPPVNPRVSMTGPAPIPRADAEPVTKPTVNPPPVPVPTQAAAPPPIQAPQGPGEFTTAFQLPNANVPAQQSPGRAPDPMVSSGPVKTPGPGEFTRAFQIPNSTIPPAPLPDPMASSGPANMPAKTTPAGPGEFTQLFRLPNQAGQSGSQQTVRPPELTPPPPMPEIRPPTLPPAAPPAAAPAGEFTRLFRAQPNPNPPGDFSGSGGRQPFPSPELPPEPASPRMNIATGPVAIPQSAPPAPKGPGEYTRVMQVPSLQSAPPPPPPASPSPATAQAVQIPISVTPPAMPSVPAPPALPTPQVPYGQASIPVPQAPSISAPNIQAPSVPAPNVQIPAPAPRSGISPAILLLGGLILVAVILVLIFALRR